MAEVVDLRMPESIQRTLSASPSIITDVANAEMAWARETMALKPEALAQEFHAQAMKSLSLRDPFQPRNESRALPCRAPPRHVLSCEALAQPESTRVHKFTILGRKRT